MTDIDLIVKEVAKVVSGDPGKVNIDSRSAGSGDVFFALKGSAFDGRLFIKSALEKGVSLVVSDTVPADLTARETAFVRLTPCVRKTLNLVLREIYRDPTAGMKTFGVTGTNGKSTTVFLVHTIFKNLGFNPGLISTVSNIIEGDELVKASYTTPDSPALYKYLSAMKVSGKDALSLEISSHALDQYRFYGILLDSLMLTNIPPEHLDYHVTMEEYLKAKVKIFEMLKVNAVAAVNTDDPLFAASLHLMKAPALYTFAVKRDADFMAKDIRFSPESMSFKVESRKFGNFLLETKLIGLYNVYNVLGAVAAILPLGFERKKIIEAVSGFKPVAGRLERVEHKGDFHIYIDYAHTPD
ncbi:MAG: UDP-N-acetylmuramyl-tripeptide synthetase, partial [Candidatus Omnitrophica bacterium]|nr:UDP-N-acetylmuramyl-tripeptide synthetase [Candidatus Omnitrophota bacterium]